MVDFIFLISIIEVTSGKSLEARRRLTMLRSLKGFFLEVTNSMKAWTPSRKGLRSLKGFFLEVTLELRDEG